MKELSPYTDERTLVPIGDDAGVYEYRGVVYLHTVDFITPILNDPYLWGAISTANSLSDIYAMGGVPLNALAVVGFNNCELDVGVLREVMRGAVDKLREAKTVLLGGHTVDDKEPKFGFAVTGVCPDGKYVSQSGAVVGQLLVITKPIGTGALVKALKEGLLSEEDIKDAVKWMLTLNDKASELMIKMGATACTDVTGFGLLGHGWNIASASGVGIRFRFDDVPVHDPVNELVRKGVYPRGAKDNLRFVSKFIRTELEEWKLITLADPVTSGGLLFTIDPGKADKLRELSETMKVPTWVVGEVIEEKVLELT